MGCDKPQGTNYWGPQGILTITVEVKRSILLGPKRSLKTEISEKSNLSSEETFLDYFFSFYRV